MVSQGIAANVRIRQDEVRPPARVRLFDGRHGKMADDQGQQTLQAGRFPHAARAQRQEQGERDRRGCAAEVRDPVHDFIQPLVVPPLIDPAKQAQFAGKATIEPSAAS